MRARLGPLDHELGVTARVLRLDAQAREVALLETANESRSHAHGDLLAVGTLHREQEPAGFRRRERLDGCPAEPRREPPDEQEGLRRVDLPAIRIDGEADPDPGDAIEEWPPGRDVEELHDQVTPRRAARPVEVGDAIPA